MKRKISAFTASAEVLLKQLKTPVKIISDKNSLDVEALWDTGAMGSCVSYEVIEKLKLIPMGFCEMRTPSGHGNVATYLVDVRLPNNVTVRDVKVCASEIGSQGIGLLIGMDIISVGDFAVSNYGGKTAFSFAHPSMGKIDFVKLIQLSEAAAAKDSDKKEGNKE